jgi:hypothetical protein
MYDLIKHLKRMIEQTILNHGYDQGVFTTEVYSECDVLAGCDMEVLCRVEGAVLRGDPGRALRSTTIQVSGRKVI